tara:strand:- start:1600 stop:1893 length:294 start_codon:yes stop_codon:yes gene_type:complete
MKNENHNPVESTRSKETAHAFMGFCSFISIINNKKVNLPNIFILLLKDSKLRTLFKEIIDVDTDFEMVRLFLHYDPSLHKSKYIMKYINSNKKKLIM